MVPLLAMVAAALAGLVVLAVDALDDSIHQPQLRADGDDVSFANQGPVHPTTDHATKS